MGVIHHVAHRERLEMADKGRGVHPDRHLVHGVVVGFQQFEPERLVLRLLFPLGDDERAVYEVHLLAVLFVEVEDGEGLES